MPLFGAHLSIAAGFHAAADEAGELGMETVQVFTRSPSQWAARQISDDEAKQFRGAIRKNSLKGATAHDSYLINLATSDATLWRKSVESFIGEVDRAELLGLKYLVTHPGAHVGAGEDVGLANVARALDEVRERRLDVKLKVLLEITAGMGSSLGHRFEHLATIIDRVRDSKWLGVCFDTCHAFAAGYPLAPEAEYQRTFAEFDRVIGLKRLKVFHVNDSKKPFGSRVDRHEHIGQGHLGLEPFRLLVNDPRFAKHPMILETPKENEAGKPMDPVNLGVLRRLADE